MHEADDAVARLESAEKYRYLFETIRDVFFHVTVDGLILDISPSIAVLSDGQYQREELIGRSLLEICADPAERQIYLQTLLRDGAVTDYEIRLCNRDGSIVVCSISSRLLRDEAGNPSQIIGNLRDIRDHTDRVLNALPQTSPIRENLEQIMRSTTQATDLCRQMLAYAGRGRFAIGPLDLSELIGEMATLLQSSISRNARLELQLDGSLPRIEGDLSQIRQIVMNLIINASEALGDEAGEISIRTGMGRPSVASLADAAGSEKGEPADWVFLEVMDTGCGMDETTLKHLFEPFFTTKSMGRGLGMAAVPGIVQRHGGVLTVESEVGRGTCFRIFFPARRSRESWEDSVPPSKPGVPLRQGRVLLVDDEEPVRILIGKMLTRLGWEVVTAADGQEALERYRDRSRPFDLVLLDVSMPRLDGEECFRQLRGLDPEARVILTTGYSEREIQKRLAGQGFLAVIEKPFIMEELQRLFVTLKLGSSV